VSGAAYLENGLFREESVIRKMVERGLRPGKR
jgi:hypothetical protein